MDRRRFTHLTIGSALLGTGATALAQTDTTGAEHGDKTITRQK